MLSFSTLSFEKDMYPISVYFEIFIQFQTSMLKIPFELPLYLPTEGLDEGSDVNFFL